MMQIQLRRAGLGPMAQGGQADRPRPGAAGPGGPPPSGFGGPPPRFKLSGAQYMEHRTAFKTALHQRSAQRRQAQAAKQTYRQQLSELTGGRLSTGRSHRGFHSAMGAYARRQARSAETTAPDTSQALVARSAAMTPYRPGGQAGSGGDLHAAMAAYFSRRAARRETYAAMHGGVAPQRARAASDAPGGEVSPPGPSARQAALALDAPHAGPPIEVLDDAPPAESP